MISLTSICSGDVRMNSMPATTSWACGRRRNTIGKHEFRHERPKREKARVSTIVLISIPSPAVARCWHKASWPPPRPIAHRQSPSRPVQAILVPRGGGGWPREPGTREKRIDSTPASIHKLEFFIMSPFFLFFILWERKKRLIDLIRILWFGF